MMQSVARTALEQPGHAVSSTFCTHDCSRDRNREHARNTRIRKKQYVENLKLQVGEMLQVKAREERDSMLDSSKLSAEVRQTYNPCVSVIAVVVALSASIWISCVR